MTPDQVRTEYERGVLREAVQEETDEIIAELQRVSDRLMALHLVAFDYGLPQLNWLKVTDGLGELTAELRRFRTLPPPLTKAA